MRPDAARSADAATPLTLVVALGGNAILRRGDDGGIATQFVRAEEATTHVARLAVADHRIALTHGNGPVVGNIVLRNEAARGDVPPMPLYIADADSQGGIGFMLQVSLENALAADGVARAVATVVTQVVVEADDPAFAHPSKPIGPFYTSDQLEAVRAAEPTWCFTQVAGQGLRRVVPSPHPVRIVEAEVIAGLVAAGTITIAAGGGGVPVTRGADGRLTGVDAVIDKDWASALLADDIGADTLIVAMEADRLYLDWTGARVRPVARLTTERARELLASGALEEGSIAPKVAACAWFAERTGRPAIMCRVEDIEAALTGNAGTRVG